MSNGAVLKQGGSNVILLARRADALKDVSNACVTAHKQSGLRQGGKFATVQMDVSQKDQVAALWDKVPQDLRDVDILGDLESDL
jgi:3-hydroxy acid dehydrogenase/malonic semialdehyde reductase